MIISKSPCHSTNGSQNDEKEKKKKDMTTYFFPYKPRRRERTLLALLLIAFINELVVIGSVAANEYSYDPTTALPPFSYSGPGEELRHFNIHAKFSEGGTSSEGGKSPPEKSESDRESGLHSDINFHFVLKEKDENSESPSSSESPHSSFYEKKFELHWNGVKDEEYGGGGGYMERQVHVNLKEKEEPEKNHAGMKGRSISSSYDRNVDHFLKEKDEEYQSLYGDSSFHMGLVHEGGRGFQINRAHGSGEQGEYQTVNVEAKFPEHSSYGNEASSSISPIDHVDYGSMKFQEAHKQFGRGFQVKHGVKLHANPEYDTKHWELGGKLTEQPGLYSETKTTSYPDHVNYGDIKSHRASGRGFGRRTGKEDYATNYMKVENNLAEHPGSYDQSKYLDLDHVNYGDVKSHKTSGRGFGGRIGQGEYDNHAEQSGWYSETKATSYPDHVNYGNLKLHRKSGRGFGGSTGKGEHAKSYMEVDINLAEHSGSSYNQSPDHVNYGNVKLHSKSGRGFGGSDGKQGHAMNYMEVENNLAEHSGSDPYGQSKSNQHGRGMYRKSKDSGKEAQGSGDENGAKWAVEANFAEHEGQGHGGASGSGSAHSGESAFVSMRIEMEGALHAHAVTESAVPLSEHMRQAGRGMHKGKAAEAFTFEEQIEALISEAKSNPDMKLKLRERIKSLMEDEFGASPTSCGGQRESFSRVDFDELAGKGKHFTSPSIHKGAGTVQKVDENRTLVYQEHQVLLCQKCEVLHDYSTPHPYQGYVTTSIVTTVYGHSVTPSPFMAVTVTAAYSHFGDEFEAARHPERAKGRGLMGEKENKKFGKLLGAMVGEDGYAQTPGPLDSAGYEEHYKESHFGGEAEAAFHPRQGGRGMGRRKSAEGSAAGHPNKKFGKLLGAMAGEEGYTVSPTAHELGYTSHHDAPSYFEGEQSAAFHPHQGGRSMSRRKLPVNADTFSTIMPTIGSEAYVTPSKFEGEHQAAYDPQSSGTTLSRHGRIFGKSKGAGAGELRSSTIASRATTEDEGYETSDEEEEGLTLAPQYESEEDEYTTLSYFKGEVTAAYHPSKRPLRIQSSTTTSPTTTEGPDTYDTSDEEEEGLTLSPRYESDEEEEEEYSTLSYFKGEVTGAYHQAVKSGRANAFSHKKSTKESSTIKITSTTESDDESSWEEEEGLTLSPRKKSEEEEYSTISYYKEGVTAAYHPPKSSRLTNPPKSRGTSGDRTTTASPEEDGGYESSEEEEEEEEVGYPQYESEEEDEYSEEATAAYDITLGSNGATPLRKGRNFKDSQTGKSSTVSAAERFSYGEYDGTHTIEGHVTAAYHPEKVVPSHPQGRGFGRLKAALAREEFSTVSPHSSTIHPAYDDMHTFESQVTAAYHPDRKIENIHGRGLGKLKGAVAGEEFSTIRPVTNDYDAPHTFHEQATAGDKGEPEPPHPPGRGFGKLKGALAGQQFSTIPPTTNEKYDEMHTFGGQATAAYHLGKELPSHAQGRGLGKLKGAVAGQDFSTVSTTTSTNTQAYHHISPEPHGRGFGRKKGAKMEEGYSTTPSIGITSPEMYHSSEAQVSTIYHPEETEIPHMQGRGFGRKKAHSADHELTSTVEIGTTEEYMSDYDDEYTTMEPLEEEIRTARHPKTKIKPTPRHKFGKLLGAMEGEDYSTSSPSTSSWTTDASGEYDWFYTTSPFDEEITEGHHPKAIGKKPKLSEVKKMKDPRTSEEEGYDVSSPWYDEDYGDEEEDSESYLASFSNEEEPITARRKGFGKLKGALAGDEYSTSFYTEGYESELVTTKPHIKKGKTHKNRWRKTEAPEAEDEEYTTVASTEEEDEEDEDEYSSEKFESDESEKLHIAHRKSHKLKTVAHKRFGKLKAAMAGDSSTVTTETSSTQSYEKVSIHEPHPLKEAKTKHKSQHSFGKKKGAHAGDFATESYRDGYHFSPHTSEYPESDDEDFVSASYNGHEEYEDHIYSETTTTRKPEKKKVTTPKRKLFGKLLGAMAGDGTTTTPSYYDSEEYHSTYGVFMNEDVTEETSAGIDYNYEQYSTTEGQESHHAPGSRKSSKKITHKLPATQNLKGPVASEESTTMDSSIHKGHPFGKKKGAVAQQETTTEEVTATTTMDTTTHKTRHFGKKKGAIAGDETTTTETVSTSEKPSFDETEKPRSLGRLKGQKAQDEETTTPEGSTTEDDHEITTDSSIEITSSKRKKKVVQKGRGLGKLKGALANEETTPPPASTVSHQEPTTTHNTASNVKGSVGEEVETTAAPLKTGRKLKTVKVTKKKSSSHGKNKGLIGESLSTESSEEGGYASYYFPGTEEEEEEEGLFYTYTPEEVGYDEGYYSEAPIIGSEITKPKPAGSQWYWRIKAAISSFVGTVTSTTSEPLGSKAVAFKVHPKKSKVKDSVITEEVSYAMATEEVITEIPFVHVTSEQEEGYYHTASSEVLEEKVVTKGKPKSFSRLKAAMAGEDTTTSQPQEHGSESDKKSEASAESLLKRLKTKKITEEDHIRKVKTTQIGEHETFSYSTYSYDDSDSEEVWTAGSSSYYFGSSEEEDELFTETPVARPSPHQTRKNIHRHGRLFTTPSPLDYEYLSSGYTEEDEEDEEEYYMVTESPVEMTSTILTTEESFSSSSTSDLSEEVTEEIRKQNITRIKYGEPTPPGCICYCGVEQARVSQSEIYNISPTENIQQDSTTHQVRTKRVQKQNKVRNPYGKPISVYEDRQPTRRRRKFNKSIQRRKQTSTGQIPPTVRPPAQAAHILH